MSSFDPTKDYYAVLGVGPRASRDEISKAYRTLAARYHPDKHQGNDLEELAAEKLAQLNEAWAVLGKDDLRQQYDASGSRNMPRGAGGYSASPSPGPGPATPSRKPGTLRGLVFLVAILLGAPFLFRIVRNPKALILIALAVAAAYFGPRILKYFRK